MTIKTGPKYRPTVGLWVAANVSASASASASAVVVVVWSLQSEMPE